MNPSPRVFAITAVAALGVLTACGGDSGPVADPDQPVVTAGATSAPTATTESSGADAPLATISPDLPEELEGAVGPVAVFGNTLVPLETDDIEADPARDFPAPIVAGKDFDGHTVRIDAVAGGPTMVVFLAHWCPHCNDEIPVINDLRDAGRFPEGLNIVGVSTAVNAGRPNFPPDRWLESKDWSYPVIADGVDFEREILIGADAFGVTGFPFVVLIDGDGTVQARWSGGREPDVIVDTIETYLTFG